MTEKPPVPSAAELREMRRQAVAYYWADGHFADWVETGEVTDRPDTWDKDLEPLYELLQKQWLAGYHARDAEVKRLRDTVESLDILRERAQLRGSATYGAYARNDARIAELEAEVARLKSDAELSERLHSRASEALEKFMQSRYDRGLDPEANCGDYHGDVAVKVIQRLEAEVAELRASHAQVRKLVTEYSHHISPAIRETLSAKVSAVALRSSLPDGAICTVCGCEKRDHELPLRSSSCFAFTVLPAAPRRTPELTERVARFLHQKYAQEFETPPFEQLSELEERGFMHEADEIIDLVFGKKDE